MNTHARKRIPVSIAQRWRWVLPVVVFSGTLVTIGLLWKDNVAIQSMVSQAEPATANVSAQNAGTLTQPLVTRLQKANKPGDVVGKVIGTGH